ncbi:ventrally expressed gene D protein [Drosophila subobscura]|uniref:ventrally expressed gene D protein n=1 Tax=Drosophila subobscura TaxID=7241 RepID=UPI00155B03FF|nr:ventrally expressed gene D protein [Drosophila subobscura]
MIPQSESPALFEDNFIGESLPGPEDCGQSRCGQNQTALEVYERILQRLQSQQEAYASRVEKAALMKQIWIASFTGSRLQYQV